MDGKENNSKQLYKLFALDLVAKAVTSWPIRSNVDSNSKCAKKNAIIVTLLKMLKALLPPFSL